MSENLIQTGYSYTDALPVISRKIVDAWRADDTLQTYAKHITVSDNPDVFQSFYNEDDDIAIWDSKPSEQVYSFVNASLEKMGSDASKILSNFWNVAGPLKFGKRGTIVGHDALLISKDIIIDLYANYELPSKITAPFAEFYLNSLQKIFLNLPAGSQLHSASIDTNFMYFKQGKSLVKPHVDGYPTLISHLSDPGSPYLAADKITPLYRTGAGQFVLHGSEVLHGFATSQPNKHGFRPRFFSSFRLDDWSI